MDRYTLTGEYFLHPTPGGAYYATCRPAKESARSFLHRLLHEPETPALTVAMLKDWTGLNERDGLEFIYRLQTSGFIQGLPTPLRAPMDSIESILPPLLAKLSDEGKAVLAEQRGFQLGATGYTHEVTEELAALGADLASVQERHTRLLHNNLRIRADGWGIVNAGGYSEIGFWPLYFGNEYFILVLGGLPRFNQAAFTTLVWSLGVRYGHAD